jgi:hypothetical protein
MKIEKAGIYRDFDVQAYHDDPAPEPSFSQSIAKVLIDQSPLHAAVAHPRLTTPADADDEAEKYVKAKAIGDAAHALMIGRGKTLAVCEADSWRSDKAKNLRADAEAAGKTPIIAKHLTQAERIVATGRAQLDAHEEAACFMNGDGEVALIWQEGPIWFRCLVDWLHADLRTVDDYKTTGMSVAPHVLGTRAADGGWDIQAAMIERGLDALDPAGARRRRERFIAQEQDAPNALNVMVMDEHWLTMGRKKLQHAVDLWSRCMASRQWPGYPPFAVTPEYPGFRETQWLAREMQAAEDAPGRAISPQDALSAG